MSEAQLDASLDLIRRLPPHNVQEHLANLLDLVPELCDDLLSSIDQPLKVANDKETGKEYLVCDYNRDADSYRSPWTNKYQPPLEDGALPSNKLRQLEIVANEAFDTYRQMYYVSGVSSVYLWDIEGGFAGVILIKKSGDGSKNINGCWDAIHVFEVNEHGRSANYKLTSTIMLWLQTNKENSGMMNLGGSMTRQVEVDRAVSNATPHINNIGTLVEDMENKMRNYLNDIYFSKTRDIVNDVRSYDGVSEGSQRKKMQTEIAAKLAQCSSNE